MPSSAARVQLTSERWAIASMSVALGRRDALADLASLRPDVEFDVARAVPA